MKFTFTKLALAATVLTLSIATVSTAEAKKGNNKVDMITKKDRTGAIRESFVQGSYYFECMKWGDCQNFKAKQ